MTSQGGKNNCSLNSPLMLASKKYIYNFLLKPFVKSFKPNDAGGFTHYLQRCTDCSTTQFAKSKVALTLPRRGYRFCGSEGGGLLKPPLRNQWWSGLRPQVAIDTLLRYKFRDHIQNFGLLSQKLSEISRFQNLVRLRFHVTLVYINCHNSLNFEATGLIFCMQSWFYKKKKSYFGS